MKLGNNDHHMVGRVGFEPMICGVKTIYIRL